MEKRHGRLSIHSEAIDVVFAQPELRIRDQERAHLIAAVIEDQRSPIAMLALARIGVFVQRSSIKEGQAMRVFREVSGYPVDDYSQPCLVAAIDEIHEVLRVTEPGRRRIVACDLVVPIAG